MKAFFFLNIILETSLKINGVLICKASGFHLPKYSKATGVNGNFDSFI